MKAVVINGVDTGVVLKRNPDTLPTDEQVGAFEARLGYKLPEDYRAFLLCYNGGTCSFGNVIEPLDSTLCDLYCFDTRGEKGCMPLRLPQACAEWGLPDNVLPIGETDGGDAVALLFASDRTEIVVISHEDVFSEGDILLRSSSFTKFL
jgi:hypothetical protein